MWLSKLLIVNYKSCRLIDLTLAKDEVNVLIGVNDCGKSTVLKAIECLLSTNPVFHFIKDDKRKSDLSNARLTKENFNELLLAHNLPEFEWQEDRAAVIGKFALEADDLSSHRVSGYSNHLQWVIENRQTDEVWIMRVFDEQTSNVSDYLVTKDCVEESSPLSSFNQPATFLKSLASGLGITNKDIHNENGAGRFKNSEYVDAIYKKKVLEEVWVKYSIKAEKNFFPAFQYLDWNISLETLQEVAKAAIRTKIQAHVDEAATFARERSLVAQDIVNEELARFTEEFAGDLPNVQAIKSNLIFSVDSKLTDILINKRNTDGDIHLDSQGDGIKRQIWFALMKWAAMSSLEDDTDRKCFFWCLDEPETHLYPKAQRELFEIIRKVTRKNFQTVVSTHSTIFVDRASFSSLYKFELDGGYTRFSTCESTSDVFEALHIRNSDFLFYDKFLVVEGDTEEALVPHLFKLFASETLQSKGIQLINLGGKDNRAQKHRVLLELLKDFKKEADLISYVFDNDISFELDRAILEQLNHVRIGKQDLEDSISSEVWARLISDKLVGFEFSLNQDDIETIKNSIPSDREIQSNQKFYPRLISEIKKRAGENRSSVEGLLPTKGRQLGLLLSEYINDTGQVHDGFMTAFQKLVN